MMLFERLKGFIAPKAETEHPSSLVNPDNIISHMDDDNLHIYGSKYWDGTGFYSFGTGNKTEEEVIQMQAQRIKMYRGIAADIEVSRAIDEIVNEIIFSLDDEIPLKLTITEENAKLSDAITESFNGIMDKMDIKHSLYDIIKKVFIDGQAVVWCQYDENNPKLGIQDILLIDPTFFYWDQKDKIYKYSIFNDRTNLYCNVDPKKEEYSREEIVRVDFGLYQDHLCLSYIDAAMKPANQLRQLEDMLILMRFSRSVSRRVFNVDIGDLSAKRGQEVVNEMIAKFKYGKYYDSETGEIHQQGRNVGLVEDYWFCNRSGGRGTTVDLLNEKETLGDIEDVLYFVKKLYRALHIPSNRIIGNPDGDSIFDYETTSTSKEDVAFFMFISRLKMVYTQLFKEILRRDIVARNIISDKDWPTIKNRIQISFANENIFVEKMQLANFNSSIDIYNNVSETQGRLFSVSTIMRNVFRMSDEEIEEELDKIEAEKKNPKFKAFYESEGSEDSDDSWGSSFSESEPEEPKEPEPEPEESEPDEEKEQ